jgi:hypothetical protein
MDTRILDGRGGNHEPGRGKQKPVADETDGPACCSEPKGKRQRFARKTAHRALLGFGNENKKGIERN